MSRLKRILIEFLAVLGVVYVLAIAALLWFQTDLLYYPPAAISSEDAAALKEFQEIKVTTEDGLSLRAYFTPPKPKKPILLLFHGNASDPAWEAVKTQQMRQEGYGVLLATYRGYAKNPGKPFEKGLYLDGEAYISWLALNYPASPTILYGESLGSGVAVELATRHQIAALILEVPFYSALSVASRAYPYVIKMNWLMRDQYRSDLKIKQVKAPVLFLLAGKDTVVSLKSGLDLFEIANEPKTKVVFEDASHVNVFNYGAEKSMMEFLGKVFP